jgi:hypothetical protein
MSSMSGDAPFYSPTLKPPSARVARPGERLFEFLESWRVCHAGAGGAVGGGGAEGIRDAQRKARFSP